MPEYPRRNRHQETLFRTPNHLLRKISQCCVLQQVLRLVMADLETARQRRDELHHAGVEKRAAHFERVRHRQPVDEREHLIRKDAAEFGFEDSVQRVARRQVIEGATQVQSGRCIRECVTNRGRVQFTFLFFGQHEELCAPLPVRLTAFLRLGKRHSMGTVAAEQLVRTVSRYRNLDVARHRFGKKVRRDNAREWLVEGSQNLSHCRRVVCAGNRLLLVIRAEPLGSPPRPSPILFLAGRGGAVFVGKREGLDAGAGSFSCQGGHERRIDSAAQEKSDRHVRYEPPRDGRLQTRNQLVDDLFFVDDRLLAGSKRELPVTLDASRRARLEYQTMRRRQDLHVLKDGERMRNVLVAQIVMERVQVQTPIEARNLDGRLQLGRVIQRAVMLPVIQRFLAEAVAREKPDLPLLVPDSDGEHAVDALGQPAALVFPEVRQYFRVGTGPQEVPALEKLFAQQTEVVDLTVL